MNQGDIVLCDKVCIGRQEIGSNLPRNNFIANEKSELYTLTTFSAIIRPIFWSKNANCNYGGQTGEVWSQISNLRFKISAVVITARVSRYLRKSMKEVSFSSAVVFTMKFTDIDYSAAIAENWKISTMEPFSEDITNYGNQPNFWSNFL